MLKLLFKNKNKRSTMLHKNILYSAILKVIGLTCSLLIVPVTLGYLNDEVYGIWLTMSSILYWFAFFDIGLGNGMRNYLTEAISQGDYNLARSYISTTLILLTGLALLIGCVAAIPLTAVDMNSLFNTTSVSGTELRKALAIAIIFTLALFVVKNIGYLFVALQKYAINDFLTVFSSVLALLVIYVLTKTTTGNLMYVICAFTGIPVLFYILAAVPIFHKYKKMRPSIHSFDIALGRKIVGKGLGFFFIQITSCLVIYGSSNLFITQYAGPKDVTTYNIAYKFFNLLAIGYTVVISPMWNAYTDAYVKGDMAWIQKTFKRSLNMWGWTVLVGFIMLASCSLFYRLWIGQTIQIPFALSMSVFFYITMFNLNNCVTYLLNGLNKIRVQIYTSVIFTAIYIVFVTQVWKNIGTIGIVIGMAASYGMMAIIHFYQCRLLISQRAKGSWNK